MADQLSLFKPGWAEYAPHTFEYTAMNCHKSRTNLKDKLRFLQEIYQVSLSLLYQNIGRVDRIKVVGVSGQVNDGGFKCSNSEVDYIEIWGGG